MAFEESASFRVRRQGVRSSSPLDLLVLLLAKCERDTLACEAAARALFMRYGKGSRYGDMSVGDLLGTGILDEYDALRVLAILEIGRKAGESAKGEVQLLDSPESVFDLLQDLRHEKQEKFVAMYLTSKNGLIARHVIHTGTLNMSLVGTREVFREAVREGAASLIVAHNHPSGDPTPSPEDVSVTKSLLAAGELMDIPLLDHIVIGHHGFVSLRRKGLM